MVSLVMMVVVMTMTCSLRVILAACGRVSVPILARGSPRHRSNPSPHHTDGTCPTSIGRSEIQSIVVWCGFVRWFRELWRHTQHAIGTYPGSVSHIHQSFVRYLTHTRYNMSIVILALLTPATPLPQRVQRLNSTTADVKEFRTLALQFLQKCPMTVRQLYLPNTNNEGKPKACSKGKKKHKQKKKERDIIIDAHHSSTNDIYTYLN